jgi:hypothetical protein
MRRRNLAAEAARPLEHEGDYLAGGARSKEKRAAVEAFFNGRPFYFNLQCEG